jgi:hypothetical protein
LLSVAFAALAFHAGPAQALEWSDNAFRLWYGPQFREPANPQDIPKLIFSFTHVDGYKWGGNFLNIDLLYSLGEGGHGDTVQGLSTVKSAGAAEVYIVYRHTLSLNKITQTKTFEVAGILRDLGIELGTDLNTKNHAFSSRKIMPLVGANLSFNVPGFLNVGLLLNKEWAVNGIVGKEVTFDVTPMFAAAWGIPVYGPISFEGFGQVNLPKGKDAFGNDTVTEVLFHPKAMVDVGTFWGSKGYQLGVGWEYWLNKFGNDHNNDSSGGSLASTVFFEAAIHL